MATLRQFPYPLATDAGMQVTGWYLRHGSDLQPLPSDLPDWDPQTPVTVQVRFRIDPARIRQDCRLPRDGSVRAALVWHCPGTGLRGGGTTEDFSLTAGALERSLHTRIEGRDLANRLHLGVNLLLVNAGSNGASLAARLHGNILWGTEQRVILEGQQARFPVEFKDFSRTGGWLEPNAAWYLDWSPTDLHQLALANLQLFVNSGHSFIREAVADSGDLESSRVLHQIIHYDVARTLIEGALGNDEFVDVFRTYQDGSVGAYVRRLIAAAFPGREIRSLAQFYRREPFKFEMQLQHGLRLFKGF